MPSFAPRNSPTKKSQILDYKIFEFLECLKKKCSNEKLVIKAENVKIAKLNLLKARLASTKSFSTEDKTKEQIQLNKKVQTQIIKWESITFSEIEKYCRKSN
ncbi:hypothetical protein H2O64_13865 [Kordia sp. YSTF-M3]|uniref:Uncharacterized protein n=1 Tax=Kordia aestuariivivens TaxID=2759037 RepID=A0ABR7QB84_9FLAO|nr:hypothetical protein [Kordia aestuariivivens]MBC8755758.1 hypothetical protein [Kordia aestuariivivens]